METFIFAAVAVIMGVVLWIGGRLTRRADLRAADAEAKKRITEDVEKARVEGERRASEDKALTEAHRKAADATVAADRAKLGEQASVEAGKLKDDVEAQAAIVRKIVGSK